MRAAGDIGMRRSARARRRRLTGCVCVARVGISLVSHVRVLDSVQIVSHHYIYVIIRLDGRLVCSALRLM